MKKNRNETLSIANFVILLCEQRKMQEIFFSSYKNVKRKKNTLN